MTATPVGDWISKRYPDSGQAIPERQPLSLIRVSRTRACRDFPCPACGAQPGQWCDGTRIPRFEGVHFARTSLAEEHDERKDS
jgi:hypothetical protein